MDHKKSPYSDRIEDYRLLANSPITYADIHAEMKKFSDIIKKAAYKNRKDLNFSTIEKKCIEAGINFKTIYDAFYSHRSIGQLSCAAACANKTVKDLFWCFVSDSEDRHWACNGQTRADNVIFNQMREDIKGGKDVSGLFEEFDKQYGCCLVQ